MHGNVFRNRIIQCIIFQSVQAIYPCKEVDPSSRSPAKSHFKLDIEFDEIDILKQEASRRRFHGSARFECDLNSNGFRSFGVDAHRDPRTVNILKIKTMVQLT